MHHSLVTSAVAAAQGNTRSSNQLADLQHQRGEVTSDAFRISKFFIAGGKATVYALGISPSPVHPRALLNIKPSSMTRFGWCDQQDSNGPRRQAEDASASARGQGDEFEGGHKGHGSRR